MSRLKFIIPLLMLALLATALPTAGRTPIAIGIANPEGRGPALDEVKAAVYAHRNQVGRFPAMWGLWSKWGDRGGSVSCVQGKGSCAFPTAAVRWLHSKGITPVLWWLPVNPGNWEAGKYERYKRIIWGKHDGYIKQWARDLKYVTRQTGKPVIVRFAHESLGSYFPWSVQNFDNSTTAFKKAWRYIWGKFQGVGALKYTRFMWSQVYPHQSAYPGDKYVSFVGVTVLNFGEQRVWKDPKATADKMARASRKYTNKPVIFAETGSAHKGGDKAYWIKALYNRAYYKHPYVKGIIYLDTDEPHRLLGQPDWRFVKPDDGSALRAYQGLASQARFKGKIK